MTIDKNKKPVSFSYNNTERCQSRCITCNGWKTPAGIKVGMNESVIQKTYGKNFTTFKKKGIKYIQYDGYHCLAHLVFGVKDHKILFILISADQ